MAGKHQDESNPVRQLRVVRGQAELEELAALTALLLLWRATERADERAQHLPPGRLAAVAVTGGWQSTPSRYHHQQPSRPHHWCRLAAS